MTAAIYARVSSVRQKEEQTIASQTAALRAHAAATGLDVPGEWVFEDEGYSGATLIRPGLERLRDLVAQIEIPVVLCYAPDRLARRYAYQALLIEEFARVGTELRFVKARQSQTPEDELLLQFQGMIAEYERAQIAERTRRGKRAIVRDVALPRCCQALPTVTAMCLRASTARRATTSSSVRPPWFASCSGDTLKTTNRSRG